MLVRSAVLLFIILLTKANSHPQEHVEHHKNMTSSKDLKHYISTISKDILGGKTFHETQTSVRQFLQTARSTFLRLQKCKPETKQQLIEFAVGKFGDFEGCINATRDIADFEQFALHTFQYIVLINKNIISVAKDVIACRNQANIFEDLKCAVTTLENSGQQFEDIFKTAYDLISELQDDTNRIVSHIKNCFGLNKNAIFEYALPLIHNEC